MLHKQKSVNNHILYVPFPTFMPHLQLLCSQFSQLRRQSLNKNVESWQSNHTSAFKMCSSLNFLVAVDEKFVKLRANAKRIKSLNKKKKRSQKFAQFFLSFEQEKYPSAFLFSWFPSSKKTKRSKVENIHPWIMRGHCCF